MEGEVRPLTSTISQHSVHLSSNHFAFDSIPFTALSGDYAGSSIPYDDTQPSTSWQCSLLFNSLSCSGSGTSIWKGETISFKLVGNREEKQGKDCWEIYKTHTGKYTNTINFTCYLSFDESTKKAKLTGEYRSGKIVLEKKEPIQLQQSKPTTTISSISSATQQNEEKHCNKSPAPLPESVPSVQPPSLLLPDVSALLFQPSSSSFNLPPFTNSAVASSSSSLSMPSMLTSSLPISLTTPASVSTSIPFFPPPSFPADLFSSSSSSQTSSQQSSQQLKPSAKQSNKASMCCLSIPAPVQLSPNHRSKSAPANSASVIHFNLLQGKWEGQTILTNGKVFKLNEIWLTFQMERKEEQTGNVIGDGLLTSKSLPCSIPFVLQGSFDFQHSSLVSLHLQPQPYIASSVTIDNSLSELLSPSTHFQLQLDTNRLTMSGESKFGNIVLRHTKQYVRNNNTQLQQQQAITQTSILQPSSRNQTVYQFEMKEQYFSSGSIPIRSRSVPQSNQISSSGSFTPLTPSSLTIPSIHDLTISSSVQPFNVSFLQFSAVPSLPPSLLNSDSTTSSTSSSTSNSDSLPQSNHRPLQSSQRPFSASDLHLMLQSNNSLPSPVSTQFSSSSFSSSNSVSSTPPTNPPLYQRSKSDQNPQTFSNNRSQQSTMQQQQRYESEELQRQRERELMFLAGLQAAKQLSPEQLSQLSAMNFPASLSSLVGTSLPFADQFSSSSSTINSPLSNSSSTMSSSSNTSVSTTDHSDDDLCKICFDKKIDCGK